MLHIIIGLVIATVLVMGWAGGNLFACVFLSLPVGLAAIICALQAKQDMWGAFVACLVILAVIWLPRHIRHRTLVMRYYGTLPAQPSLRSVMKGEFKPFITNLGAAVAICLAVALVLMPFFPL